MSLMTSRPIILLEVRTTALLRSFSSWDSSTLEFLWQELAENLNRCSRATRASPALPTRIR